MRRRHTPYGYQIENGIVVVSEEQAEQIWKIYKGYLGDLSFRKVAKVAGMTATQSLIKRFMQNPHYLGDDFYPVIIDREIFDAFEVERQRREEVLVRRLIKRITVYEDHFEFKFKSGLETEVKA